MDPLSYGATSLDGRTLAAGSQLTAIVIIVIIVEVPPHTMLMLMFMLMLTGPLRVDSRTCALLTLFSLYCGQRLRAPATIDLLSIDPMQFYCLELTSMMMNQT